MRIRTAFSTLKKLAWRLGNFCSFNSSSTIGARRNKPFVRTEIHYRGKSLFKFDDRTTNATIAAQEPLESLAQLDEQELRCVKAYLHLVSLVAAIRNGKPIRHVPRIVTLFGTIEAMFIGYGYRAHLPVKGMELKDFDLSTARRTGLLVKRQDGEPANYFAPKLRRHIELSMLAS